MLYIKFQGEMELGFKLWNDRNRRMILHSAIQDCTSTLTLHPAEVYKFS